MLQSNIKDTISGSASIWPMQFSNAAMRLLQSSKKFTQPCASHQKDDSLCVYSMAIAAV